MRNNLLALELSSYLCSVSLNIADKMYYKESINKIYTTKSIIFLINSIFIENNITFKDLDLIVFGTYPTSLTNKKSLILVVQSLSLIWKIPVIIVPYFFNLSFESFFKYTSNKIVILIKNENKTECHKVHFSITKNFVLIDLKKISNLNITNHKYNDFILISNFDNIYYKNFFKKIDNILPKAIYTNLIAKYFVKKNEFISFDKIKLLFNHNYFYKKYY